MSHSKLHHYNPRSVLRNFSIQGKGRTVWVFDKTTASARPESISSAGSEKYFNHVEINGKGIDFESVFDRVDAELPNLLSRIIHAEKVCILDEPERRLLSLLAVVQFLRVKIVRDTAREMPSQLRKSLEDAGLTEWATAIPLGTDNDGRRAGLSLLHDAEKLASSLLNKELTLYKAPEGCTFWTSDNPIVMFNHFPGRHLGFNVRGIEVFWPICPSLAISFRCPSISKKAMEEDSVLAAFLASEPLLLCRPSDVEWMNTLQVGCSTRFIYASDNDFSTAQRLLAEDEAYKYPPLRFSIGPMGSMPIRHGMPKGISLIVSGSQTEHLCPVTSWKRESGRLVLVVPKEAMNTLEHLLNDAPFQVAEVYDSNGPGERMCDVTIAIMCHEPIELIIEHRDSALRILASQLDEKS